MPYSYCIDLPEPDIMSNMYGASSGSYPDLDRFNRITSSRWTKETTNGDKDFYDTDVVYDRNSNVARTIDNIHKDASPNHAFDVNFTMDNLDRLTKAEEGNWNGSSISVRKRQQIWDDATDGGLSQTGNWRRAKLDLNGDGNFTGGGESDDDRTHSKANEIVDRDTDNNGTANFTLTHDPNGNLTDDGQSYKYEYDVFGRLRKVRNQSNGLVAEYRYNGLGYRIAWHYDVDADTTVEDTSDDPWFYFAYDEDWRLIAVYRDADTVPKEQFTYHQAGLDGSGGGGSLPLDNVMFRDKDANTAWGQECDGTLEQRYYYCHNWRGDMVAILNDSGTLQIEQARYSAYGVPFGLPAGDTDADGDTDATDASQIRTWGGGAYQVRGDMDLDGDVDSTDESLAQSNTATLGWGVLSKSGVANRQGYAGYERDGTIPILYHVRYRTLNTTFGRFITRDPIGYDDGTNLYEYAESNPLLWVDPYGLRTCPPGTTPARPRPSYPRPRSPITPSSPSVPSDPIDPRYWDPLHYPPDYLVRRPWQPRITPTCIRNPNSPNPSTPSPELQRQIEQIRRRREEQLWRERNCPALEQQVSERCKADIKRSCMDLKPGAISCEEIKRRIGRFKACIEARERFSRICFNGPDPRHLVPLDLEARGLATCQKLWNDSNCDNGGPMGPPLHPDTPHPLDDEPLIHLLRLAGPVCLGTEPCGSIYADKLHGGATY